MTSQTRSSDEASRLYKQLTDQISDENEAEIRRTYKQLLRNGESLGAIVGAAISSIREMQDGRERGGSVGCGSVSNEVSEARRVPVELRQDPSEVALQQAPVVDAYIDRPRRIAELQGADGDDGPFAAARQPAQIEPTQVSSVVETHRPGAAADRVDDTKIEHEPHLEITGGPRLNSPAGGQYLSLASRPHLMKPPTSAATRVIIVLATVLVAAAGISLLLRMHRPADEDLAAALHPAAVSPPTTLAIAAEAAGLSGALSSTVAVAWAGLNEEKRPTVIMPSASQTEQTTVILATPVVVPTEAPVSPAEVAPLMERGDALLATGDFTSARLFYEAAANAGDANAALRLGAMFDPIFIDRANLRGVRADIEKAVFWYRRARDLGSNDADNLLKDLTQAKP